MSPPSDDHTVIAAMVRRARNDRQCIASLFTWIADDDTTIAATLGCDTAVLNQVGLCLRPREAHWRDDIDEIATRYTLDFEVLAATLQRALVREGFATPQETYERDEDLAGEGATLLAARDHEHES